MQFLYEYMTADELEIAKENAKFDNMNLHFENMFSKLALEHVVRINDIDTGCLIKESTIDELEALYEREMTVYMEGVKEAWEKFKKWIRELFNKLTGKNNEAAEDAAKKNPDKKIEIPFNPDGVPTVIDKITTAIRNHVTFKDKATGKWDVDGIFKNVLGIGEGIGIAALFAKFKEPVTVNLSKAIGWLQDMIKSTKGLTDEINKQQPNDTEEESLIQKIGTPAVKWLNEYIPFLRKKIVEAGGDTGEDNSDDKGKGKEGEGGGDSDKKPPEKDDSTPPAPPESPEGKKDSPPDSTPPSDDKGKGGTGDGGKKDPPPEGNGSGKKDTPPPAPPTPEDSGEKPKDKPEEGDKGGSGTDDSGKPKEGEKKSFTDTVKAALTEDEWKLFSRATHWGVDNGVIKKENGKIRVSATTLPSIATAIRQIKNPLKRRAAPDPDKIVAIQKKLTAAKVPFLESVIDVVESFYDSISDDDYMIESFLNPIGEEDINALQSLADIL